VGQSREGPALAVGLWKEREGHTKAGESRRKVGGGKKEKKRRREEEEDENSRMRKAAEAP
jgi:hypothetical protein